MLTLLTREKKKKKHVSFWQVVSKIRQGIWDFFFVTSRRDRTLESWLGFWKTSQDSLQYQVCEI